MSIFNIAFTGLNAYQSALSVVSNNIANATTPGYSRQTVQFNPGLTQNIGSIFLGTGVSVNNVMRNSNDFANYQVRNTSSLKSQYETFFQQASQVDQMLSPNGSGLSSTVQSFFTAVATMNSNPADLSSRTPALKQAQLLANQFNTLQNTITKYQQQTSSKIDQSLAQMNTLTKNIATLNQQLVASPNSPDLMDQRDSLVQQLAQYMDVTVVSKDNGSIDVGFGNGQTLVSGTTPFMLSFSTNQLTNTTSISMRGQDVTSLLNSGSMRGLLDYQNNILGKTSQSIGQMAIGLAQAFNSQQALGVDANNKLGSNLFTDYNSTSLQLSRAIGAGSNTGTAVMQVAISDISQTKVSDYELTVTDAVTHKYNLVRKSDGVSIPMTWDTTSSASPATLSIDDGSGNTTVDGITITLDDITNFATGDLFSIAPTRSAAAQLNVTTNDPKAFALAAAVSTKAASSNTGQGTIALGTVYNTTAVNNNYSINIDPVDPTQYTITGDLSGSVYSLIPGSNNTIYFPPGSTASNASYSVVLSGTPNAGDQFNLGFNTGAVGDNRNGLLLAAIQQSNIFSGGSESLIDRYTDLVATVGADTNDAKLRANSADVVYNQAVNYQSSISGVNLDEEASNLLKYQQAYQAAGKVMQVANDMMNVIFSIMG